MVSAPFIMNFMFPVPLASLPAVEICWQGFKDGIRYDDLVERLLFGSGSPADEYMLLADYPSYCQEEDLQFVLADGVAVDLVGQGVDEADDPLGHRVARGGLGSSTFRSSVSTSTSASSST